MSNNLSTVTRIGAGVRLTESAAADVAATAPEGFDVKARGAVTDLVHAWACGDSERPPVKVGKAGAQRATDYGRGVDALTKAVKRLLTPESDAITLRASLSGEGGGSATIPADHPLYAAIVALIVGEEADAA